MITLGDGGGTLNECHTSFLPLCLRKGQFLSKHKSPSAPFAPATPALARNGNTKTLTPGPLCVPHQVYSCSCHCQFFQPAAQTVCSTSISRQSKESSLSLHFPPSFVCQRNCTSSRNRKELQQSVKEPVVKASFFTPQWCHPSLLLRSWGHRMGSWGPAEVNLCSRR